MLVLHQIILSHRLSVPKRSETMYTFAPRLFVNDAI